LFSYGLVSSLVSCPLVEAFDVTDAKAECAEMPLAPTPPTDEERNFYYFGLPSKPRLLARSSVFTWSPQFKTGFQTRKVLKNVGDHPIVERYNEKVREEIIGELGDMCWNAIDVVRIGYDIEGSAHYPIILWISVQPNSTTWASAHQTAINC
jgi:hypothetical protein